MKFNWITSPTNLILLKKQRFFFFYLPRLFPRCQFCKPLWIPSQLHRAQNNGACACPGPLALGCFPAVWCLLALYRSCTQSNRDSCRLGWTIASSNSCTFHLENKIKNLGQKPKKKQISEFFVIPNWRGKKKECFIVTKTEESLMFSIVWVVAFIYLLSPSRAAKNGGTDWFF